MLACPAFPRSKLQRGHSMATQRDSTAQVVTRIAWDPPRDVVAQRANGAAKVNMELAGWFTSVASRRQAHIAQVLLQQQLRPARRCTPLVVGHQRASSAAPQPCLGMAERAWGMAARPLCRSERPAPRQREGCGRWRCARGRAQRRRRPGNLSHCWSACAEQHWNVLSAVAAQGQQNQPPARSTSQHMPSAAHN